ncbi:hypothetical protein QUA70_12385 [Microcoleus sp. LAD1_D5]|uniref:hypothetical protein n=1 Tax=unclassified Microcoleus TaxID=2642155 RepID=UPI002FCE7AA0
MARSDLGNPQIIPPTNSENQYCRIAFTLHQQGILSTQFRYWNPDGIAFFEREGVGTFTPEGRIINSTFIYKEYISWPIPGSPLPGNANVPYVGSFPLYRSTWGEAGETYGGGAAGIRYTEGRVSAIRAELNNYWGADMINLLSWDVKYRYKIIYSSCPEIFSPFIIPSPLYIFYGTAAPPPPPPPNMNCCSCNDIATILAENAIAEIKQHQATRDLIDRRTIEGLREINKMLQGMQINLDLQPIIDRLNQLEANLWNGLNLSEGGGN